MLSGSIVALVTPFRNGEIDFAKIKELVEFHIKGGTSAISPCGTTGESPTLSHEEHDSVISEVVQQVRGCVPVVAGTGSNSTREALRLTRHARKAGADAALVVTPYYNRPTQEGLYRHYKALAEEVDIPIVVYNVPTRTGVSISPETVARLAEFKNIVAIKEASGNIDNASDILRLSNNKITVLSGDDSLTLPILSIGGKGVISVAANIVPGDVARLVDTFLKGNTEEAAQIHNKLFPLCKAMFIETNPIPVKTAMKLLGRLNGEVRLPLCEMSKDNEGKLSKALKDYGLI